MSLFIFQGPNSQLIIIDSGNGLAPSRPQAITWTNDDLDPRRHYASRNYGITICEGSPRTHDGWIPIKRSMMRKIFPRHNVITQPNFRDSKMQ